MPSAPGEPESERLSRGPLVDIRVRWRAGQVSLALAAVLTLLAALRPLGHGASPYVRLGVTLALGLGVAGTAFLASLRGRGPAEQLAFYTFLVLSLDGLGQILGPAGWPVWPLMALLVGSVGVAEPLSRALLVAALAAALGAADAWAIGGTAWRAALAGGLGYAALAFALNRALKGEKRRLSTALAELARLKHGIDQLDEGGRGAPLRISPATQSLRQVSEEGRRARQVDRAAELDEALGRIVAVTRGAVLAHAVLYFEIDRSREVAFVRAADGPPSLVRDAIVPLGADPFAFVLDRRQAFYATDFKRLLWALPYYRGEVKVGSLLAVPVFTSEVLNGVLVADRLEIQAFVGAEPGLLESFAGLVGDAILRTRASMSREELGAEFKAVYTVSRNLASASDAGALRRHLLRSARDLVSVEAGAVVTTDEAQTRYTVDDAFGWAQDFEGREVGLSERTWAAWVLRSAEDPYLLDHVAGQRDRMPILVLDEGSGRAESLLALPLKTRNRTLGALVLTGRRGSFDATANRVLGILANQGAAALSTIQLMERIKETAVRDGLTGLYNRRAFDDQLAGAAARQDRAGGTFALLLVDVDEFKKLNDTYGHPAGDAALRNTAQVLEHHLRKGDQAARFGGEEFVVILPGTDEAGALHLGERIRTAIEKSHLFFEGARLAVTASFGAAVWPADGRETDALLAAADRALYAAKQAGRNRVISASSLRMPEGPGS